MPKPLLYILAVLPLLLLAALLFGRAPAPRGCEPHAFTVTRSVVHVRSASHAPRASHTSRASARAVRDRTTIDDDDEYEDGDDVETAMLAPRQHPKSDVASDTASDGRATNTPPVARTATATALHMTCRGIRPSGEHRSAADRPPRS